MEKVLKDMLFGQAMKDKVTKEAIKFTFNQKDNYDGSKIKILLGTPSIKEGYLC